MNPKISIITINYNNKEGLERTFKSVFSQTYKQFEYLVIDGGSNDGSKELIEKHAEEINYWVSEPDQGIYNAMNKGIKVATGEYVFFLNSGDVFLKSDSLEIASIEVHTEDIIYFNIKVCGKNREFVKECPAKLDFEFFYIDTLPHQSTFIKHEVFEKVGIYDENLKIVADWKWFMTAVCKYNINYKKIDGVFSIFYLDGISSNPNAVKIRDGERKNVLNNSFPYFISEYERRKRADLKLEGYETSRIVKILKKVGFLKGLK